MAFVGKNLKINTTTNNPQSADPSNPVEGMVFYSDGTSRAEGLWVYKNSQWVRVGKDSGGLDVFYTNDFEEDSASDLSSGNNASFDSGGVLAGTLADETASPLSSDRSISYTQASGSLNDWFHTGAIALDDKQKKTYIEMSMYSTYDGDDDDIIAIVYDDTNDTILEQINIKASSNVLRNEMRAFVPASCSSLKVGFQTAVENIGAELIFDDIELKMETVNEISWQEEQTISHTAGANTMLDLSAEVRFNTSNLNNEGDQLLSIVDNAGSTRTEFTANVDCLVDITLSVQGDGAGQHYINLNGTASPIVIGDRQGAASVYGDAQVTGLRVSAGDVITFQHDSGSWRSTTNPAYVYIKAKRPLEAFTKSSRVPENTFSARIENNGSASLKSQGASFFGTPTRNSSGNVTIPWSQTLDEIPAVTATFEGSVNDNGISVVSVSTSNCVIQTRDAAGSVADLDFNITVQRQGLDYQDPRKAFMFLNQTVYLKDVKANSTNGGSFNSGSAQTRVLNTLEGDAGFCSLSSNQFTLAPGKYEIQGEAPAYQVNGHRAWIHNVTDGTDDLIGSGEYAGSTGANCNITSRIMGTIEITDTKTFELRHECQTSRATDGFGTAGFVGSFSEIFSQLKITRIS